MSQPVDPALFTTEPADPAPADPPARPRISRHPVDPVSLVAGLLAVGIALIALLDLDVDPGVVLPLLLVLAGAAGLVSAARRSRT